MNASHLFMERYATVYSFILLKRTGVPSTANIQAAGATTEANTMASALLRSSAAAALLVALVVRNNSMY